MIISPFMEFGVKEIDADKGIQGRAKTQLAEGSATREKRVQAQTQPRDSSCGHTWTQDRRAELDLGQQAIPS